MTHEQFTQIYLPFSGKMYALAYNLLRNRDEARDCVQDVYSELWIKRDTIEPDKPEETPTVSVLPPRPKYLTKEETQALLADYRKRYKAQLPSTRGTRPDPQAPIDKNTKEPKRYFRLDNFIRSMTYLTLKAQQTTQLPQD